MMGYWHYQVMKHPDGYGLHEYYPIDDEDGPAWTENSIVFDETLEGLKEVLHRMLRDIDKHGVVDYK